MKNRIKKNFSSSENDELDISDVLSNLNRKELEELSNFLSSNKSDDKKIKEWDELKKKDPYKHIDSVFYYNSGLTLEENITECPEFVEEIKSFLKTFLKMKNFNKSFNRVLRLVNNFAKVDKFNDPKLELNPFDINPLEVDKALEYYKKYPEEIVPGDKFTIRGVRGNHYTSEEGSFLDILKLLKGFPKDARLYDGRSSDEIFKDRIGKYQVIDSKGYEHGPEFVHEEKAKAYADYLANTYSSFNDLYVKKLTK